jgi:hypothetical protein
LDAYKQGIQIQSDGKPGKFFDQYLTSQELWVIIFFGSFH